MRDFSTIHIFGYGETQVVQKELGKKVKTSDLTTVQAVIDNVFSLKPENVEATIEYHTINIFKGMFVDFNPKAKEEKSFRIKYADIDASLIDALYDEIQALEVPA